MARGPAPPVAIDPRLPRAGHQFHPREAVSYRDNWDYNRCPPPHPDMVTLTNIIQQHLKEDEASAHSSPPSLGDVPLVSSTVGAVELEEDDKLQTQPWWEIYFSY